MNLGCAALEYGSNRLSLLELRHDAADAATGNPYNTTFRLEVVSGDFSGVGLCTCDMGELIRFARELDEMDALHTCATVLEDLSYGSHVRLTLAKTGHIQVSGLLYGEAGAQKLQFGFDADQTALRPFADALNKMILK